MIVVVVIAIKIYSPEEFAVPKLLDVAKLATELTEREIGGARVDGV